jgi:hypothetical protein
MRQGDGAIGRSYNIQFTTDAAQGLVVGVAVAQASNDTQELPLAMDRFQQQHGSYPAQVVADGGFTNHESVIAMQEILNSSGASGSVACSDPRQKEEASIAPNSSPMMPRQIR